MADGPFMEALPGHIRDRVEQIWADPVFRWFMALGCWIVILGLAFVAAGRLVAHDRVLVLMWLNSFTYYMYWPAWVAGALAWVLGRREAALLAVAVVAMQIWFLAPDFAPAAAKPDGAEEAPQIRLVTANVYGPNTHMEAMLQELMAYEPDILLLQEFSFPALLLAERMGLHDELPYRAGAIGGPSRGNYVFSRFPLEQVEMHGEPPMIVMTVDIDGVEVRVFAIHPPPAIFRVDLARWNRDFEGLVELVTAEEGKLIVAGDFNATQHSRWHRELTSGRLTDAHRQCGRGTATTWPDEGFRLPPIRIDHVLLSDGLHCMGLREGKGPGSDHRPVVADIAVLP